MTDDDDRLKRGFAKLREADAKRAPAFDALVRAGRPRRRSPWAVVVPITSAVAAAAVFVLWCSTQQLASESAPVAAAPAAAPAAASATAQVVDQKPALASPASSDPAPLDFLLQMPGTSALAAMPTFDDDILHGRSR